MTPLVFVWTLESVFWVSVIGLAILWLIIASIRFFFKTLFKKNCEKCKHCKLYSVSSCGGPNTYHCDIKNHIMHDTYDFYVKCEEFEKK